MNIFVLDREPKKSALYHCNKHVVKMVLETAQLLSTAIRIVTQGKDNEKLYKLTHFNHPCSLWVRNKPENFYWTVDLGMCLASEFTFRFNKIHKSKIVIETCYEMAIQHGYLKNTENLPEPEFIYCGPDKYRENDVINSYRSYYQHEKVDFAKYTNRDFPEWLV